MTLRQRFRHLCLILIVSTLFLPTAQGQRSAGGSSNVYKTQINPSWIDGDHFWYRNDLHNGKREFILVDAERGERKLAFDHEKLAAALTESGITAESGKLPIKALKFDLLANQVSFSTSGKSWVFDLATKELKQSEASAEDATPGLQPLTELPTRFPRGEETHITFINQTKQTVGIFWVPGRQSPVNYATLKPGQRHRQHTFAGHVWQVIGNDNSRIAIFQATAEDNEAFIKPPMGQGDRRAAPNRQRPWRNSRRSAANPVSPDGQWRAEVQADNVTIVNVESEERIQLSTDGTPGNRYGGLSWSPDSKSLAAFRIEPVEAKKVYRLNSAIGKDSFRSQLQQQGYPLPGDEFTKYEPSFFDIDNRKQIKPEVDRIDFGRPRFYWIGDHRATYQKVDRGHQRFRLIEIDGLTGQSRNIIDEQSETFIWTMHTDVMRYPRVSWLDGNKEIIYVSEMDGYRHLFLIDVASGTIKNTITPGQYVVNGVDRVDEEKRQIWFRATGMNEDQDPYFTHFYRINFDGTELVELTDGNGTHSVVYSPNGKYLIDRYSRVDLPPVHNLRRVADGRLVCELETSDVTHSNWRAPTVFVAKGRDGETDIWGLIEFPEEIKRGQKLPIIEDIYAGPQGYFTPKSFSSRNRYKQWTDLGFVVVKLDGMGTAGRSKAFHDVCWHNLKDAGFPDRIKWIKAAAKKYPCMDISRVGIYGTSAGGQSAAGALLFHGDFYDVAVASCGCHDNRMDKSSWNEQWMGYPVGPHYSRSSNIDNAANLRGKLMLIIGEVDSNVPPASTFKFADALIKANKDFELVYLPGVGHSSGGAYGNRKRVNFFRKHLLVEASGDRTRTDPTPVSE
jgi:dienelactone hydrolase